MRTVIPFFRLLGRSPRGRLSGLFLLMLLSGLTDGVGILLLVPLLDSLQPGKGSQHGIVQQVGQLLQSTGIPTTTGSLLLLFLILIGLRSAIQFWRERLNAVVQYRLIDQLRLQCFAALLESEWRWMATRRQSDHASLLLTEVSRVAVGLNFGLSLMASLATMAAYIVAALSLSLQMTLLALVSGGLVFFLLSGQRRTALKLGQGLSEANRDLQSNIQESLLGIKLAKILGNESRYLERLRLTTGNFRQQQVAFTTSTSLSRALFQTGGALLLVTYLLAGLHLWHTPLSELLTLVLVFSRIIPMFTAAQQQFHYWLHALPALQATEDMLTTCREFAEPPLPDETHAWPLEEAISLTGVSVRYAERERPAIDSVSIAFPAHKTTAIMGASGSGKSTLADLLMGLLAPDSGEIRIDGRDLSGSGRRQWRHCVAYVPQEVFLFNDTIRNNLLWGNPAAAEAELRLALERAAAQFVFALPQGLETMVGDGGILLSGGERQRLALARALLKRPALLILDEATSALDRENEARVRRAIEQLHGDLTMVIIGHRLPTLENADQVLIMEDGRIKTSGTWDDIRRAETAPT